MVPAAWAVVTDDGGVGVDQRPGLEDMDFGEVDSVEGCRGERCGDRRDGRVGVETGGIEGLGWRLEGWHNFEVL